jgi:glucokinase
MPEEPLAIGVDIGGTAIKLGRVRPSGEIVAQFETPSPVAQPQEEAVREVARAIARLADGRGVRAVGIGCAGLVDSARGIVHLSPNLPRWRDAPIKEWLSRELSLPVTVLNDANAFALAEAQVGAGRGHSPVVGITLGTGVGGAIVENGRLWGGRYGFSGEVGHISLELDGPPCPCGNRGCLELYVGRRALVSAYLDRAGWEPGRIAFDLAAGERQALEPRLLYDAANRGDHIAREVFARAGIVLGVALANLTNLLDPEVFVVGGGVAQAGDLLLEPARRTLAERAMMGASRVPPVIPAALGMSAGLIGAALQALRGPAG